MPTPTVKGTSHPAFAAVRALFSTHLQTGTEIGASLCVSIHGETVLDLWGGSTSTTPPAPWEETTLVPVWSLTKLITALSTLLLIDRGQLSATTAVSHYWPAFTASPRIQVRHLLSHTSGLAGWDSPGPTASEILDVEACTARLIAQSPWWEPGTASGYHILSYGFLLGGLIRQFTGRGLSEFIHSELVVPLGAAGGFFLDVPEREWARIAALVPPPPAEWEMPVLQPGSVAARAISSAAGAVGVDSPATPGFRHAEMGASDGFGNARAINRILEVVTLKGVVGGKRFLKEETVDLIFQEQVSGVDLVLGAPVTFGVGMAMARPSGPSWLPDGRRVGYWTGWGGSLALMDVERGVTVTYTMNKMDMGLAENERAREYVKAIYAALDGYLAATR
ncbi:serine hydrolase domain-containing protein [Aspergillus aculeatinus CBS 121060]|uniref:Beta-lactamase n=1 Tax=Aspergillus aculeatinus CBS 121060 TaxID=1448322 RepID=A0ACD1H348_9EURO|nr:beta-lactamase [Aspergillus aculeatinus CBS 121060]RAH67884.1 beta-lactamase [Aspergillus aculeatinus CBS 121060]